MVERYYRIREVAPKGRAVIVSLGIFKAKTKAGAIRSAKRFKISKSSPLEVKIVKKKNLRRYSDIIRRCDMKGQRYGKVGKNHVYIMDKATKKTGKKGFLAVQSIETGDTAFVKKNMVKNITTKYKGRKR